jgi:hypothetical protein
MTLRTVLVVFALVAFFFALVYLSPVYAALGVLLLLAASLIHY